MYSITCCYCAAPWPKSNLRRVHTTHFIRSISPSLGNIQPSTSWWAEILGFTRAFLVSLESQASSIPRKNPQHRTGNLAHCCFLPARDVWQSHDCGWGMQQPLTGIQRDLCHKRDRGDLISLGRRGKGFFWAEQIRVQLSSIYQNYSQILGSTLWYFRAISHCYIISMWQYNARAWTEHLSGLTLV